MSSIIIDADSVNQSVNLRMVDSGDGTLETGVVAATTGLDIWYKRDLAAPVSLTESNLALHTTAHTDGGLLHTADGDYRIDFPDAAFATGVDRVKLGWGATGMVGQTLTVMLNIVSAAGVNTEIDTALSDIGLDHLLAASVSGSDVMDNSIFAKLVSKSGTADFDDFVNTSDSLQATSDAIAADGVSIASILALLDDPRTEPGQGAPPVNPDIATKIDYLYKAWRNKGTQTATTWSGYNDGGSVVDQKTNVSDDGTIATRGEIITGP
ncbi:MAG: hypothetical protein JKY96_04450 [Phycisphaerales bacterium]|nr:hypothetical protein [Phycisphaerales bacterium]